MTETVQVTASAPVLDTSSARIGVNVSPVEVEQLPVNGRNFANLMTLATGATSDGNGGWSSVRFNGKSNQQNYLNYDGVDGTYVWDASPGYLSATGSQFRLQTSMESVAEFRVNSGLAPAESGLGAGGNITVISKSGSNRFRGSLFEYRRDDAFDSASKYDDIKQQLDMNQFGGSFGGPIFRNRTFFFASYEGLRQTTGLSFTEAVPSAEARRRVLAGEPVGSGGGQSPDRTRAVAPLLDGFPVGQVPTSNVLVDLATLNTEAEQQEDTASIRLDHQFSSGFSAYLRYMFSDGEVDTPDRTVTPRRVLAKQSPKNLVANFQNIVSANIVNEFKVGWNGPKTSALAFGPAGYDPTGVSLSGSFTSSSIDARGTTGIARSGLLIRATSASTTIGSDFDPMSLAFSNATTWTAGAHTFKFGGEYRRIQSDFQFLGSNELSYNSINDFIDNRLNQVAVTLDSPVFQPQQFYAIGFLQDSWRAERSPDPRAGPALRLLLGGQGGRRPGQAVLRRGERVRQRRRRLLRRRQEQLLAAAVGGLPAERPDGAARRVRAVLRAGTVRGPDSADRELHHPQPRPGVGRRQQRPAVPGAGRRSCATCCRSAATPTTTRTSTTCSTAPACRASCRGTSTSPSATPAARARTCSCAASATSSTR